MERDILTQFINWKNSDDRVPLIVLGARQIGKTYTMQQFAKEHYKNSIYVNFEKDGRIRGSLKNYIDPKSIISYLEVEFNCEINPENTLIIFDEIQSSDSTLTSLKYFNEEAPQYHIIAAGSLLGVAINRDKFSFPVGKVKQIKMYPLSYFEFLDAVGKSKLKDEIKLAYTSMSPLNSSLHQLALDCYIKYLIVGGMPAVVNKYIETNSYVAINSVQEGILNDYAIDMTKYASPSESVKIKSAFDSIPVQLSKDNKKFQYKLARRGGTSAIFGASIDWLERSGIALKCIKLLNNKIPLKGNVDLANFKLYMLDIGLLNFIGDIPKTMIMQILSVDNTFLGSITENYVAAELIRNKHLLSYWESAGKAELDFMLQISDEIIPVEVKKGIKNKSKSLNTYIDKYHPKRAFRISAKNFGITNVNHADGSITELYSLPLYVVGLIDKK